MKNIKQWPKEERPRERLLKLGADKLSTAELIAILLGTGNTEINVLEQARYLLNKFKSLRQLLTASIDDLIQIKGIGPAKISKLKAILALSSRFLKEGLLKKPSLETPEAVHLFLSHSMRDLNEELLKVIFLNSQKEIIEITDIAQGGLTGGKINPRAIIALALKYNTHSMVLVHNHPSGNPTPSQADKIFTGQFLLLAKLLEIELIDHIIIGNNCYFSFANEGLM